MNGASHNFPKLVLTGRSVDASVTIAAASPSPAAVVTSNSGDGLGIHEPGSMTRGGDDLATAPSGRACLHAKCPAVTGTPIPTFKELASVPSATLDPSQPVSLAGSGVADFSEHCCIGCDVVVPIHRMFCDVCEISAAKHPSADPLGALLRGMFSVAATIGCPLCGSLDCTWTHGLHEGLSKNANTLRVAASSEIHSSIPST